MIEKLFKLQKECVRLITNWSKHYHTDPLFKQFKVLKIQEIKNLEMVKLIFLMMHDRLLRPIMDAFQKNGNKRVRIKMHRYNTRKKNTPNILSHNSELFNKIV